VIDNQLPPELVVATAVKSKLAPVLLMVIICARGLSCPKVVLKLSAGIGSSFCAHRRAGAANPHTTMQSTTQGRSHCVAA
jgi:hypothetical protein